MTLEEIKAAIAAGKTVHWSNAGYQVILDKVGQYLIAWNHGSRNASYIGLTWLDGLTMNCNDPSEFFIGNA